MEYLIFLLLVLYRMPWMFAEAHDRDDATRILVSKLLVGWTLPGWLAAWLWARSTPAPPRVPELRVTTNPHPQQKTRRSQLRSAGLCDPSE